MTTTSTPNPSDVTAAQIAELLSWARSLSTHPHAIAAAERSAFQVAKTDLLDHITDEGNIEQAEAGGER